MSTFGMLYSDLIFTLSLSIIQSPNTFCWVFFEEVPKLVWVTFYGEFRFMVGFRNQAKRKETVQEKKGHKELFEII